MWWLTAGILGVVWYSGGVLSFIYWWTQDNDLTVEYVFTMLLIGVIGPIAWIIGLCLHGQPFGNPDRILVRKRGGR